MRRRISVLIFSIVLCACPVYAQGATEYQAKVLHILDGDTIDVLNLTTNENERLRLCCIDAPEKSQAQGPESIEYLISIVPEYILVEPLGKDRYGRTIAIIKSSGETFTINELLVLNGFAMRYPQYCKQKVLNFSLKIQEFDAKLFGRGIWGTEKPAIPPWEYRRGKRWIIM